MDAIATPAAVKDFLKRWKGNTGSEKSNFQSFIGDLCTLLELPQPNPGEGDNKKNAYIFERFIAPQRADSTTEKRFIDLYKRNHFVLEGKQTNKELASKTHQNAINAAVAQAERYVRGLPANEVEEGRPPFIIVVDVGNAIYTYSEFTRTGGNYVAFPDPRHHEIRLDDLHKPEIQHRLRTLWLDPLSLDPSKHTAKVTRQVSTKLAELAKSLEASGHSVERVASFLKRCLFTMFAEDVDLLPKESFYSLLVDIKSRNPEAFTHAVKGLWETMNTGGYSERLMINVKCFNGGLFKGIDPIALDVNQIQLLIDAASADWRYVEPAIFGTLLERALDPRERHKLGAHYTPRAYVERLVMPTLIDPLREQWGDIRAAAETLLRQGKEDKALEEVQAFHFKLCQTRVLDPACGSANFLYVALEHMKRLEGEVLAFIAELSGGQGALDAEGLTVSPHQFLGLEINPRAAQIAELVLWIGYLQWHYRLNGNLNIPEPILKDFKNIECRDALIEYDSREPKLDAQGKVVTIWDGISMKVSPTTGNLIPDETGQATVYQYKNPRQTDWPKADYIIGNPPFIGNKRLRTTLGDGYVDAIRLAYKGAVPDSADFVMFWWQIAAEKVRLGEAFSFGFITTNSIKQAFNRRVIEPHLTNAKSPLSLIYAIPDHPWVDGNDGAAVRIAMTVGAKGNLLGNLLTVQSETENKEDSSRLVVFNQQNGKIFSNLAIGADITSIGSLKSNSLVSNRGVIPHGAGMVLTKDEVNLIESSAPIRPYRNGRDLAGISRGVFVIDCYGLNPEQIKESYPKLYQWLLEKVKPARDIHRDKDLREKWWLHRRNNDDLRNSLSGLKRYIVTGQVSKHRFFSLLDQSILPDDKLIAIALNKAQWLGVLSSRIHVYWAFALGGALGVGNDPVYNKGKCFEAFPFPTLSEEQTKIIAKLAESIDKHRKRQQAEYPNLTMTDMYNVLEKLRLGEELTAKEKTTHQQGLIALLAEYHDELDTAVFEAYGWTDLVEKLVGKPGATTPYSDKPTEQAEAEEELLMRLVALNKERAEEEAKGVVRWLRPDYQAPDDAQEQTDLALETVATSKPKIVAAKDKATFPKAVPEQLKVLRETLAESAYTLESLADTFKRKPVKSIEEGLQSLVAVGLAEYEATTQTWHLV